MDNIFEKSKEYLRSKTENVVRRVAGVSQNTSVSYHGDRGKLERESRETEPAVEIRARTDGKNVAVSYSIPQDRQNSYVLSLTDIYRGSPLLTDKLQKSFGYMDHLMVIKRDEKGAMEMFIAEPGMEIINKDKSGKPLEKSGSYIITDEVQNSGRIVLKGKDGGLLSIRIHSNLEQNLTEREKFLAGHKPEIRRIHNEGWLNSKHVPSAYVPTEYSPELDRSPLNFLKKNDDTVKGKKWVPFCPDRDLYWGIAARNLQNSCDVLEDLDVCIALSDTDGIEHSRMPLDMPRTYLTTEKVLYLKPEIENKARKIGTEGSTGIIHLGNDPHDGWYYVTQPIPKIQDNKIVGYFALIGRKATLIPKKEDAILNFIDAGGN